MLAVYTLSSFYESINYGIWILRMKTTDRTEDIQLIWAEEADMTHDKPEGYASGFSRTCTTHAAAVHSSAASRPAWRARFTR